MTLALPAFQSTTPVALSTYHITSFHAVEVTAHPGMGMPRDKTSHVYLSEGGAYAGRPAWRKLPNPLTGAAKRADLARGWRFEITILLMNISPFRDNSFKRNVTQSQKSLRSFSTDRVFLFEFIKIPIFIMSSLTRINQKFCANQESYY